MLIILNKVQLHNIVTIKILISVCIIFLACIQKLKAQSFDAEIINYTTHCEVNKDKLSKIDTITIQINNRAGDKYTDISIPYSKIEKVSNINAWIEDMNGNKVRILKKSDITDKSAISDISLYEDSYNKCFQLKHNIYPYKVTYTYQNTLKNYITINWWTPIIYNDIPTKNASLQIILPKGFQFLKYINNIAAYQIDSTESCIIFKCKSSYSNPIKSEIFSQSNTNTPYVIVAPLYFFYGVEGSTKNWQSYGNWQYNLMKGLDILPESEKTKIATLVNGITDKKEIVKTLYHYLQDNTRYINVSIGIGGYKPYPASYVSQNRYGDCKALTNYMKAVLNYVGIESFCTKVYASEQPKEFVKSIVCPQFNHIVLAVPINKDTVWLENTSNTNPFEYIGTFIQNREALLVSKDHSKLVRIPALKRNDNRVSDRIDFELKTDGSSTVNMRTLFHGAEFERYNQLHNEYNNDEKDRVFRYYLPFDNYEVVNWELNRQNRDSAKIELRANLTINKVLRPLGKDYYLSLFPCRIPRFTIPENRKLPVNVPYPLYNTDTLTYLLPKGYDLKRKIDPISIKTPYGNYDLKLDVINGKIQVIKSFELYSGSYTTDQYPEFYSFIKSTTEIDRMNIVITPHN